MKYLLALLFGVCAGCLVGLDVEYYTKSAAICTEDTHLLAGSVINKYSETVEKEKFYYVTIAGKVDGKYHTRDIEVNKWMWIHSIRVGDYWAGP